MIPIRIQRTRKRGASIKKIGKELNGLSVVYVGRGSKWGNPFKIIQLSDNNWTIKTDGTDNCNQILNKYGRTSYENKEEAVKDAITCYQFWLMPYKHGDDMTRFFQSMAELQSIKELKGKNLSCWCPIIENDEYHFCHADLLLSLSNDVDINKIVENNVSNYRPD